MTARRPGQKQDLTRKISATDMKLIATGLNAFETNARPEGTVKFLATPRQVIELVTAGRTQDFIILVRGGTTTFLSPVLTAGTLGILTMSGAPESHLGILSREFQIPCVLTLAIESGVKYINPFRNECAPRGDGQVSCHAATSHRVSDCRQNAGFHHPGARWNDDVSFAGAHRWNARHPHDVRCAGVASGDLVA